MAILASFTVCHSDREGGGREGGVSGEGGGREGGSEEEREG